MEFVDPSTTPFIRLKCRGELPHLYKPGCTYFVTFRLCDAVIPSRNRIDDLAQYGIEIDDDPEALLRDYDPPITLGSCLLRRPEAAQIVNSALSHFDGDRYELIAWCVMPNHVHVIFTPGASHTCDKILHSWKSFTAHAINRVLNRSVEFGSVSRSIISFEGLRRWRGSSHTSSGTLLKQDFVPVRMNGPILV